MQLRIVKTIFITSLFFILINICPTVNAANYGTINSRTSKNNQMISAANSLNSVARSSYTDKYLKDLETTSYKGLTSAQQSKINSLASKILNGNSSAYSNYQKLEMFTDWIIENFYYYGKSSSNNPYYLIVNEYNKNNTIRAKSKGYASTLIALARSQGIPSRIVGGYYNKNVRDEYTEWGSNITKETINHVWVEAYVNSKWIMIDPVADSYKTYNDKTKEYKNNYKGEEDYQKRYFNPSSETLAKTHIAFRTYTGSKDAKYVYNTNERKALVTFLNKSYNKISNGKKINSSYNSEKLETWFAKNDNVSKTNGYGNLINLNYPTKKSLRGNLNLSSFTKLESLSVYNNKLTGLRLTNMPLLKTVNVSYNNMTKITVTGSKNLKSLKTRGNPATYIKYNFGTTKRTAVIKATKGGTVSVNYTKGKKNVHVLKAVQKKGYVFKGWYKGSKKVSKSKTFTSNKAKSFAYYAKFEKKNKNTYIKVSISKQKLWYYKKGKLKLTTNVVTGQRYKHDTPRGTYTIKTKARNVYLIGDDYKSYVNYWMPFYGGYGLHDATWRSSFGGTIYKYDGSHGCINLPYSKAKYLYNHISIGTTVKIIK